MPAAFSRRAQTACSTASRGRPWPSSSDLESAGRVGGALPRADIPNSATACFRRGALRGPFRPSGIVDFLCTHRQPSTIGCVFAERYRWIGLSRGGRGLSGWILVRRTPGADNRTQEPCPNWPASRPARSRVMAGCSMSSMISSILPDLRGCRKPSGGFRWHAGRPWRNCGLRQLQPPAHQRPGWTERSARHSGSLTFTEPIAPQPRGPFTIWKDVGLSLSK
jgi:hypothetical protein